MSDSISGKLVDTRRVKRLRTAVVILLPAVAAALYLNHLSAHWVPDAEKKVKQAQQQQAAGAFAALESRAAQQPESAAAQTDYANALIQKELFMQAMLPAERAVAAAPSSPQSHLLLAMVYSTVGYTGRAMEQYHKSLELAPDNMEVMQKLGEYLLSMRDTKGAEEVFLHAEKAQPQSPGPRMSLASIYISQHKNQDVIDVLDPVVANIRTAPPAALYLSARGCEALGKTDIGLERLAEAVRRQPNFAEAYHTIGSILCNKANYADGIPMLEKAAALAPTESTHEYALGNAFFNDTSLSDRLPRARRAFEQSLELNPQDAWAHYYYGFTLEQQGERAAALREYDRALEIQSNFDSAWYRKGAVYTAMGNLAEAKRCYAIFDQRSKRAITAVHGQRRADSIVDTAEQHYHRGMDLLKRGDKKKARDDFQIALQLDPNYAPAKRALQDAGGQ